MLRQADKARAILHIIKDFLRGPKLINGQGHICWSWLLREADRGWVSFDEEKGPEKGNEWLKA